MINARTMRNYKGDARKFAQDQVKSLIREVETMQNVERRLDALAGIVETMPKKVLNRANVNFYGHAGYYTVDIRPKYKEFTEHDTMLITAWCASNDKWDFAKNATYSGNWMHSVDRRFNSYEQNYKILFHGTSNIDGCELVEVVEMREVKTFKVKC